MVNQPLADLASVQSLLQSIQHQVGLHGSADAPAHDAAGEHVYDESDVHEASPGGDVRVSRPGHCSPSPSENRT